MRDLFLLFFQAYTTNPNFQESFFQHKIVFFFTEQKEGGTQLKLIIDYGNSFEALFKPMR